MPLLLDTTRPGTAVELRNDNGLTIGLVNNMPDTAVEAIERQFVDLLRGAAAGAVVRLKLFAIATVPRGVGAREELARRYRDVAELWEGRLDGLIVTGTEPRAANLKDEPYWETLTKVVDWAREHTTSTIWSCLAAHAAVLHCHGVTRRPLVEKQFGVFDNTVVAHHSLLKFARPLLRVPHSRHNDLPEQALTAAGYRMLTHSAAAGVDTFAREERNAFFLFLQGHPEYETGALLREYRRDIGRFLRGERERYPALPQNYLNGAATVLANDFRKRAEQAGDEGVIVDFPMVALEAGIEAGWRPCATNFYRTWIDYLRERKMQQRAHPARLASRCHWPDSRTRPAAG